MEPVATPTPFPHSGTRTPHDLPPTRYNERDEPTALSRSPVVHFMLSHQIGIASTGYMPSRDAGHPSALA